MVVYSKRSQLQINRCAPRVTFYTRVVPLILSEKEIFR